MEYWVLGKKIELTGIKKPPGVYDSIFEFNGNAEALEEIGLQAKFYYTAAGTGRFGNEITASTEASDLKEPANEFQRVLAIFLYKSIYNGHLSNQYEPPLI